MPRARVPLALVLDLCREMEWKVVPRDRGVSVVLPGCVLDTPGEFLCCLLWFLHGFLVVYHARSPVPMSTRVLKAPAKNMVSSESKCN